MRVFTIWNVFAKKVLQLILPEVIRVVIYPVFRGRKPVNLLNEKSFTSFVNRNKLYCRYAEVLFTQDKLLAKKWVSLVSPEVLIPEVLAESDSVSGIDFDCLPINTVLKTNHGCGYNFIYTGQDYYPESLKRSFHKALKLPFNKAAVEWSYFYIKPKVFIEKLIPGGGENLNDYKIFVFYGKAKIIQVDLDRFTNHVRNLYTPNWDRLNVQFEYPNSKFDVEKPAVLETMLSAAEKIASPFSFLRVDFYLVGDDIYFGEVAHYPEGGYGLFDPKSFDQELMLSSLEDRDIDSNYICNR